jgi:two-component system, chemotaxis family, protein-glutamate methylesterase/glutaminase
VGRWINTEEIARDVIVIGASTGGAEAVTDLLSSLPEDLEAIVGVVVHRTDLFNTNWAAAVGRNSRLRVLEPEDGDVVANGTAYLAPSGRHMRFQNDRIALDGGSKEHGRRPAIDPLFVSAADSYGDRVVGVVLTGGGHDGTIGLLAIAYAGGFSFVQKPSESAHPGTPESALAYEHVSAALTLDEIGDALQALAGGQAVQISDSDAPVRN